MKKTRGFVTLLLLHHGQPLSVADASMRICDKVFDHGVHVFINELIRKSPSGEKNVAFLAYDEKQLIGYGHLVDTPMDYFSLEMKGCELGIVATDPAYQKR
jgi:predicted N-acetyltransferase YhbS